NSDRSRACRMGGGKAYPFLLDEARCSGKDRIQCSEPASIQISQMRSSPGASGWPASVKTRAARAGRSFLPPLGSATAKSLAGWSPSRSEEHTSELQSRSDLV